jgi:outer membrane protein OmpA-like peptidoglycan-associated protein
MKTNYYLAAAAACASMLFSANNAAAQETVVVEETTVTIEQPVECKTHYSSSWRDNWFIQLGAGVQVPFVEKELPDGSDKRRVSAVYNLGFGHWFSPYLGFRISGMYGKMRYDFIQKNKAQMATVNADLMWDMTSSICGVNPSRVFSFIPFVGIGGTYTWDFTNGAPENDVRRHDNGMRSSQWTLPVSAGFQLRFRLCKYVDFFAEARAQFYGDNFNNYTKGDPIEANITAIGGLSINIGERNFQAYNPCDYLGYINQLNGQVNDLRGELAATTAALAAANAQLPCPEVKETAAAPVATPMLAAVRFKINSAKISEEEMVNVYNVAEWMKANPNQTITIQGYADEDTGTAAYNQELSQRRANAVKAALESYGVNAANLNMKAYGSSAQPYSENNWNRIVIFSQP